MSMAKPTIVTRAGKGAPLSWEEGDANFTNLQNAALPTGGAAGYILAKSTANDYDVSFVDGSTLRGPIGYTGSQGDTGAQGIQGIQGIQGSIGYTGSQGIQGIQGAIGYTGSAGADGAQGPIGYTGSQGETGIQGAQGEQGVIGYTGSAGADGAQGIQGEQGPAGADGSAGADGAVGINWTGPYNNGVTYTVRDAVEYLGSSYVMTVFIGGAGYNPVDNPGSWNLIASKGDQGIQGETGPAGADADPTTLLNDAAISTTTTWSSDKISTEIGTISGGGITAIVQDTAPVLGGTLSVNDYAIVNDVVDGNIVLETNGTGSIVLNSTVLSGGITSLGDGLDLDLFGNNSSVKVFGILRTSGVEALDGESFMLSSPGNTIQFDTNDSVTSARVNMSMTTIDLGDGTRRSRLDFSSFDGQSLELFGPIIDSTQTVVQAGRFELTGNLVLNGLAFPSTDGTAGQVLTTDGAGNLTWATSGGGSGSISTLTDVVLTNVQDTNILMYVAGSWVNEAYPSFGVSNLEDTAVVNPQTNDVLVYNAVTGKWENSAVLGDIDAALIAING